MGDEEGGLRNGHEKRSPKAAPMGDQEAQGAGSPGRSGDTWAEGRQVRQHSQDQPWVSFAGLRRDGSRGDPVTDGKMVPARRSLWLHLFPSDV